MTIDSENPRINSVVNDLAAFTGLSPETVRARMCNGIQRTAEAFRAFDGPPEAFYIETDAYLFELAAYEDDPYREALAERVARAAQGALVLEFGCGIGTQAVRFAEAGLNVVACDTNRHNSAFLAFRAERNAWGQRLRVVTPQQSVGHDAVYDIISCQHVLEHVDNPQAYIRRFLARLRPGGLFLGVAPFDLIGPDFPEHRVEHEHQRLENLCTEAGFQVTDVSEFGGYQGQPFWLVIARKPA